MGGGGFDVAMGSCTLKERFLNWYRYQEHTTHRYVVPGTCRWYPGVHPVPGSMYGPVHVRQTYV